MKYLYWIVFFVGIGMLTVAGIVWYLRRDTASLPAFNPFQGSNTTEVTQYDPPSQFDPGEVENTIPITDEVPTELIPTSLPPNLSQ